MDFSLPRCRSFSTSTSLAWRAWWLIRSHNKLGGRHGPKCGRAATPLPMRCHIAQGTAWARRSIFWQALLQYSFTLHAQIFRLSVAPHAHDIGARRGRNEGRIQGSGTWACFFERKSGCVPAVLCTVRSSGPVLSRLQSPSTGSVCDLHGKGRPPSQKKILIA